MKHTKGEWRTKKNNDQFVENEDGESICSCWIVRDTDETRLNGESWLDMRKRTESERIVNTKTEPIANAKLIVQAPKMLKALQDIYDAQFNPKRTLADLNSTIKESMQIIKNATQ